MGTGTFPSHPLEKEASAMTRLKLQRWQEPFPTTDALKTVQALSPEPLYESGPLRQPHRVCLVCGKNPAFSALRSPSSQAVIVPLCKTCSVDWNFYGYGILKKVRPAALFFRVTKWFVANPYRRAGIWGDLVRFLQWQRRMGNLRKRMKSMGR
jgi:hypothetical protein